ncbi:protein phosphatase 1 regulatory subunit 15A [Megalops cyprinoides]|uniref:protein phosphatase 1 regulatory subunit 15A n=1 Tax=Megalops cyprinoides TaxID=118141 RepID=UPI001863AEB6|nr:protein phosphatase 1 regulatory subunit 15A [Megalops cyprinoides]
MRMNVANMAPGSTSHSPFPCPLSYGLPSVILSESLVPFPSHRMMRSLLPAKMPEAETRRAEGLPVFRILCEALRYLRETLSKILDRCGAVMEAIQFAVSPALALDVLAEMGLGEESMWESAEERRGPTGQGWMWAPEVKMLEEEDLWAPDVKTLEEEELLAPDVDVSEEEELSVKGECECLEDGGELDLAEWLEWDSGSELSEDEGDDPYSDCDSPSDAILELPLGLFDKSPISHPTLPSHTLTSEGEQEDDSESDWSEEEEEDDDEDWDGVSEANSELWESFLRRDDPYNPFGFSFPAGKTEKSRETTESCTARPLHITDGGKAAESKTEKERSCPPQAEKKNKKVRFSDNVQLRPLVAWAFASRAARDGSCWQEMARDRDRFRRRVQAASDIITPCLLPQHRARVWEKLQLL